MINHLRASVTFTTPLKTTSLKVDFSPQPGITAVVGRNGSGKSWSVLEVPRFLLFGKKALRGAAPDYKTLTAEGSFTFKGKVYTIARTPQRENIKDVDGVVLAVGAEAVTAKVVELLGYGLEVFDLCNASVQKKTDKLGQLRPAQRKELIDRVVGLTDYETVEKACREESKTYRREAEALAKVLVAPGAPPVPPLDTRTPDMLRDALRHERQVSEQAVRLSERIYRGVGPLQPMMPRTDPSDLERVKVEEAARAETGYKARQLDSVIAQARRFVADSLPESQLLLAEARNRALRAIENRGPPPTLAQLDIEETWGQWALFDAYQPSDSVECPNCHHSFCPAGEPPAYPHHSKEYLREQAQQWAKWDSGNEIAIPQGPNLTTTQIAHMRESNKNTEEFNAAVAARQALPVHVDQSSLLNAMTGAITAWAVYDAEFKKHQAAVAASEAAQSALNDLGPLPTEGSVEALQRALSEAEGFERDLAHHFELCARFQQQSAEVEALVQKADKFKQGAEALGDARATLKAHLAPLLSRVASKLIHDMTVGELSSVYVDDNMEISVDGQAIETLSGAGETVANLALRMALGQVLVRDTFPVFLGDEIDSDADDQRREATKVAIQALQKTLTQIILVSHRQIDIADHVLDLDHYVD